MTASGIAGTGLKATAIAVVALLGFGAPAGSQPQHPLAMLDTLEPGLWELKQRDGGGTERVCLRDARRLIQMRHAALNCERTIVDDEIGEVVVQYTCRGHGYGLTRIRRETTRLIQVESQGVSDGLPFVFDAEGRRIGACAA